MTTGTPDRMLVGVRLAALTLCLIAFATPTRAQDHDLGEITLVGRPGEPGMVITTPIDVPRVADADLPADAVALHARWLAALEAREAAREALDDESDPDADRAPLTTALARADVEVTTAEAALLASLVRSSDQLSRPAILRLGMLQRHEAEAAFASAQEGCTTGCPTNPDCTVAMTTWARVVGTDVIAAFAMYERAEAATTANDYDARRELLERVLALDGLPPELAARAARDLGLALPLDRSRDIARTYGRCATLGVPDVSDPCALLAAEAFTLRHDERAALAILVPLLSVMGPLHRDAVASAATVVAEHGHGGAAILPRAIPVAVRGDVLELAATRHAHIGNLTFALELVTAAEAIAPDAAHAEQISVLEHARAAASETPEHWLRRSVVFCLASSVGSGSFDVRGRFGPHGATGVRFTIVSDPQSSLGPVGACLRTRAPAPEGHLTGTFTARVVVRVE